MDCFAKGLRNAARRCVQLALAPAGADGDAVVFAGGSGGGGVGADAGAIGAWDVATGARVGTLRAHAASVSALAWRGGESGGGELFSGGDDGVIVRWVGALAPGRGRRRGCDPLRPWTDD